MYIISYTSKLLETYQVNFINTDYKLLLFYVSSFLSLTYHLSYFKLISNEEQNLKYFTFFLPNSTPTCELNRKYLQFNFELQQLRLLLSDVLKYFKHSFQ